MPTNTNSPVPPKVRLWLYIVTGVGTAVATFALAKGWIGSDVMTLIGALAALVNGVSASHVDTALKTDTDTREPESAPSAPETGSLAPSITPTEADAPTPKRAQDDVEPTEGDIPLDDPAVTASVDDEQNAYASTDQSGTPVGIVMPMEDTEILS